MAASSFDLEEDADTCASPSTDDGPGIPPEDQERIFERFYRVSGSAAGRHRSRPGHRARPGRAARRHALVVERPRLGQHLHRQSASRRLTAFKRTGSLSRARLDQSIVHELEQARMFFAVHRHHLDQHTLQTCAGVLVLIRKLAQMVRTRAFFLDQSDRGLNKLCSDWLLRRGDTGSAAGE